MKTGLTLEQLAAEITRQQSAKEDYVVNTGNLRLESYGPDLTLRVLDSDGADRIEPLEIGDIAHRQIGTHLSIPAKYYERMRSEDPGLLAHNVNTWLERTPAQRMIRVLDGKARAYLSNRYLRMDNYSIASAVLPILAEIPDVRIESCQITDSRMYIKAVNPRLQEDVTPGDTVQAGVVISNSEVGLGSVNIQPLIYRLVCSNGMVVNDAATKRNHIGRATDAEENFQLYSEKTLAADDHAFLLKVQDTVRAAAEELAPAHADEPGEWRVLRFDIVPDACNSNYNGTTYIDTMSRKATDRFIELTHEQYREKCGDRLGTSIKGIFTDDGACRLILQGDGRLHMIVSGTDMGQGFRTAMTQVAAETLDMDICDIYITNGDTELTIPTGESVSERQTLCGGARCTRRASSSGRI